MRRLRSILFSKWFFAMLFVVSVVDLGADIAERAALSFAGLLNIVSIVMSLFVALLAGWMFFDLHTRKPG